MRRIAFVAPLSPQLSPLGPEGECAVGEAAPSTEEVAEFWRQRWLRRRWERAEVHDAVAASSATDVLISQPFADELLQARRALEASQLLWESCLWEEE